MNIENPITAGVPITDRDTFLVKDLNGVLGYDSGIPTTEITEPELYTFLMGADCKVSNDWKEYLVTLFRGCPFEHFKL